MNRTSRYDSVPMATMRTYGDGCAIALGLDLVGERWALLVVRELILGPKRYTDLRRGLPNASPNVLSERLRELERAGVGVYRRVGLRSAPAGDLDLIVCHLDPKAILAESQLIAGA